MYHERIFATAWVEQASRWAPQFWRLRLCAQGPAIAGPLAQAGTGTITGQVLSLDNIALPNVHLAAFAQAPSEPNRTKLGEFQSDAEGRYSVQVPAGQVWMEFETQDINGQSFWGYDNLPVDVTAGQTVSGQDFRVAIRIVSEPPTPVPGQPTAVLPPTPSATAVPPPAVDETPVPPLPELPTTGHGVDLLLVSLAWRAGYADLMLGIVQRRKASRYVLIGYPHEDLSKGRFRAWGAASNPRILK